MPEPESACHSTPVRATRRHVDHSAVKAREKCSICFPDGIPDEVQEVIVGRHNAKVHLPDDADLEADWETTNPETPRSREDGIAAKIGAEDFGPEDLGLEPTDGGEA